MNGDLPGLDLVHAPCPHCGGPLTFVSPDWCWACHEPELARREAFEAVAFEQLRAIQRDHAEARKRARTWQVNKAVQS